MDSKSLSECSSSTTYEEWDKPSNAKRQTFIDIPVPSYQLDLPPSLAFDRTSWSYVASQIPRLSSYSTSKSQFNEVDEKHDNNEPATSTVDFPQGFSLAMIVLAVVFSFFLVSLDLTIVATAIPKVTDEFQRLDDVSWYSAAFFLTTAGFQSTWGKAYKYFPLKTTFLTSIAVFEIGSLLCGAAPASVFLIIGRAIAGIGGAGIGSGCYTILGFSVEPKKRPVFTGIVGASYGIASVLGPLLGGILSDVSWRWCFYLNIPFGAISMLAILVFFQAPAAAKPQEASWKEKFLQMDPVGAILMMGAVISLLLALQKGGQRDPWDSPIVIGLLVSAGVILCLFGGWEAFQGERAMIVPRLLKQPLIRFPCLYLFFLAGGYYTLIYNLPLYFQSIDGASPTESGIRNLPLIVAVSIMSILSGSFVSSTGLAAPLMPLGGAISTIAAGLLCTLDIGTEPVKWITFQLVAGIGFGISMQIPMIISQSSVDPSDLASITAVMMFFQTSGAALFLSAAESAFINTLLQQVQITAPGVSPEELISTGSTMLQGTFRPDQIPGILKAYMSGLRVTFEIVLIAVFLAFLMSTYVPWKKLGQGDAKPETSHEVPDANPS